VWLVRWSLQDGASVVWVVPWRVVDGVESGPGVGQIVENGWGSGAALPTQGVSTRWSGPVRADSTAIDRRSPADDHACTAGRKSMA